MAVCISLHSRALMTRVGQTDDDDNSHRGCRGLPPIQPTAAASGAGTEHGQQRGKSERMEGERG